jgi:NAD(P)-dependent dehydrogenase (short-subunit alcohol dehydrogenase family)
MTVKTAVVVGATNGIGKAISCRLAQDGFKIIAIGRDKDGTRRQQMMDYLTKCSSQGQIQHEFRACDAFELMQVKDCAEGIVKDYGGDSKDGIDALVMTQGMATIQSFTPTTEGNDEKLTLHFWSRAAFATALLPALRTNISSMPGGPVVMSILSGGVHAPYKKYESDPELRKNYSIKNAADFAGYYTDLFFDKLAQCPSNQGINFIHAAPGFVASNWGTEMPSYLRGPIRLMQKMGGKSPEKCADFMVRPILKCADGEMSLKRPGGGEKGLFIMNEDATSGKFTKSHTADAMSSVWGTTKDVLSKAGISLGD